MTGVLNKALEALDLSRALIRFHVKAGACIDVGGKIHSATGISKGAIEAHAELKAYIEEVKNLLAGLDGSDPTERHYKLDNIAGFLLKGIKDVE